MDVRQKISAFVVLALLLASDSRNHTMFVMLEVACIAVIVCGFARDLWQWLTEHIKRNLWLNNVIPDAEAEK